MLRFITDETVHAAPRDGVDRPAAEVTERLVRLLDGLDLDAASTAERLAMRRAVNAVDPMGLISGTLNEDEYDPEVDHLIALARAGRLDAEAVETVFAFWFGPSASGRDSEVWQAIADGPLEIRYLPGDQFVGVDPEWLLDHLVLDPKFGRVHLSPYESSPTLSCVVDGEELDVLGEIGAVPVGPGGDFGKHPVATVGNPGALYEDMVSVTLYRAGPWLVSVWSEVHEDYLPLAEDADGSVPPSVIVEGVWAWVIEMVVEWAAAGAQHDLPVVSAVIDASDQEQMMRVAEAARGGRGVVSVNGVVVPVAA